MMADYRFRMAYTDSSGTVNGDLFGCEHVRHGGKALTRDSSIATTGEGSAGSP
jgi:hypothetical protein